MKQLGHVKRTETSREAWKSLNNINKSKNLSIMLLGTLATKFESFCKAMKSRNDISTVENLKIKKRNAGNTVSNEFDKNEILFTQNTNTLVAINLITRHKEQEGGCSARRRPEHRCEQT